VTVAKIYLKSYCSAGQEIRRFYETRKFITAFKNAQN